MTAVFTHVALHVRDVAAVARFYGAYCGMEVVRKRGEEDAAIIWLAEPGREKEFVFVLLPGGPGYVQAQRDYSHLGFALESRAAVDEIARRARREGCLLWGSREEPYPVGYYCGVRDPDGNVVEFSYGQPLGPGAGEG
ncbi:MAG: VOC family protein [Gammaproteobacteria bacterium]